MIVNRIVRIVTLLPRGGYTVLRFLARIIPQLRAYPIDFPMPSGTRILANLGESVFYPLLKYKCYPHQVAEDLIIVSILKKGDIVIDVGANIGWVSAIAADCVGTEGKVYSFEPSKKCITYLNQLSALMPQVQVWPVVVSNTSGTVKFLETEYLDRSHIIEKDDGDDIPSVSLDTWSVDVNIPKLDFLKVDAEGFDYEVIVGSIKLIGSRNPIIEFEAFGSQFIEKTHDLLNLNCADSTYRLYRVYNRYPASSTEDNSPCNNYFAIPACKLSAVPRFLFDRGFLVPVFMSQ